MILAGKKVAWNAFAVLDGFGQKAPPVRAAKDLVDNVMAAVTQAGHVVSVPEGASSEEVTHALQLSFVEALPQAWQHPPLCCTVLQFSQTSCISGIKLSAFVNDHIFLFNLVLPQVPV